MVVPSCMVVGPGAPAVGLCWEGMMIVQGWPSCGHAGSAGTQRQ